MGTHPARAHGCGRQRLRGRTPARAAPEITAAEAPEVSAEALTALPGAEPVTGPRVTLAGARPTLRSRSPARRRPRPRADPPRRTTGHTREPPARCATHRRWSRRLALPLPPRR